MPGCRFDRVAVTKLGCLVFVGPTCQDPAVDPIRVAETAPGEYFLSLEAETTNVDDLISELGHEPNGYFWEGDRRTAHFDRGPSLRGRFSPDPEGGAFVAHGNDRAALDDLAVPLCAVAADGDRLRRLVEFAEANGFEFND